MFPCRLRKSEMLPIAKNHELFFGYFLFAYLALEYEVLCLAFLLIDHVIYVRNSRNSQKIWKCTNSIVGNRGVVRLRALSGQAYGCDGDQAPV